MTLLNHEAITITVIYCGVHFYSIDQSAVAETSAFQYFVARPSNHAVSVSVSPVRTTGAPAVSLAGSFHLKFFPAQNIFEVTRT
jgi:hypothetical protein